MEKQKDYLEYVEETEMEQIQQENGLEEDEILLPEVENILEFVMVPVGKYEMLVRDSEKLASISKYIDTERPLIKCIKALLEVE